MSQRIDAIFENGVFRPQSPVTIPEGERVWLNVESNSAPLDDLSDVADLPDVDFIKTCRQYAGQAPSIEEVQRILSAFKGSLADRIIEERDER